MAKQEIAGYRTDWYETIPNAMVALPDEEIGAAIGIIQLYEKILKGNRLPELLESFITLDNNAVQPPLTVAEYPAVNPRHSGQMGFEHPLSPSQRKSLYSWLNSDDKVFAINGPPGTGKTTLLQSVVANKLVESVIRQTDPPIILACSTNNQAVTNIIESFLTAKTRPGPLEGRWLLDLAGFATYLPSNSKSDLDKINYKKPNGEGLFEKIEEPNYLEKARRCYLQKASSYLGVPIGSVVEITVLLREKVVSAQARLIQANKLWQQCLISEKSFTAHYLPSSGNPAKYYANGALDELPFRVDLDALKDLEPKVLAYFNQESLFRKILCQLGLKSALRSRHAELRILLRDSLIEDKLVFPAARTNLLEAIDQQIEAAKTIVKSLSDWNNWKIENAIIGNPPKTDEQYQESEHQKIERKGLKANGFYDELDIALRHEAFQLAVHYWEGRWLLQLSTDLKDERAFKSKGEAAVRNRWRRQAMLTPCFVSTFYMAPKFFRYFKYIGKDERGESIFDKPPLYDFIDLLIVDEAGQVSPEVGVATFALAKQAVVVGDMKQIEPVWNITAKIDLGNLKKSGLIKSYDDSRTEKQYDPKGFLASTGSIMRMAQNASHFKEPDLEEKGVLLVEHRRCYNEIIDYCNTLAYNGQLKPLRGKAPVEELIFPPMYCIHVEGQSSVVIGSRQNEKEATAIVDWLTKNRKIIEAKYVKVEAKYGKDEAKYRKVEEVVGIITPFVGQKNALRTALEKARFDTSVLKMGTVHALQGAERPIILFSMVYGKDDSGTLFFDRDNKPNMLNVAVSRAKDNFIVFANTAILNPTARTPSGLLAGYLTYESKKAS